MEERKFERKYQFKEVGNLVLCNHCTLSETFAFCRKFKQAKLKVEETEK